MDDLIRFSKTLKVPIQEFLPDTIHIHNVNEHGQGGPNIIMGDYHFHLPGDTENTKMMMQLLQKILDKLP